MSFKEDLQNNLLAIKRAKILVESKNQPTSDDLQIINQFSSWGNFKELLYPYDVEWRTLTNTKSILDKEEICKNFIYELQDIFKNDFDKVYNNIRSSIPTSFYTEPEIVSSIFDRLSSDVQINSFLDPCVGGGIYIDEFIKKFPNTPKQNIYAIDIDPIAVLLTKAKHPEINVINIPFEEFNSPIKFDLISSNIPFANERIFDKSVQLANATIRVHNYFLYKTNSLLTPNGILQLVTTGGLLNSKANKDVLNEVGKALSPQLMVPLSTKAFKGTEVNAYYFEAINDGNPQNIRLDEIITTEDNININSLVNRNEFPLIVYKNPYGKPDYSVDGNNRITIDYFDKQKKLEFSQSLNTGVVRIADFYLNSDLIAQINKNITTSKYQINKLDEVNSWLTAKEFKEDINSFYGFLLDESNKGRKNIKVVSNNEDFKKYFEINYFNAFADKIKLITERQTLKITDTVFSGQKLLQGELLHYKGEYVKVVEDNLVPVEKFDKDLYSTYMSLKDNYKSFLNNNSEFFRAVLFDELQSFLGKYDYAAVKDIDSFSLFVDSLTKQNVFEPVAEPTEFTIREAYYKVLNNKDSFTLEDIIQYCNNTSDEVNKELKDLIIFNPIIQKYQQRDYFLSGNLYDLRDKVSELEGDYKELIAEITENLPERILYPQIKLQFGTRWLDLRHFKDFVEQKYKVNFKMQYNAPTDMFIVKPTSHSEVYGNETFRTLGNRYVQAEDIISNAFYHTYPIVKYSETIDGKKITHTDTNSTELIKRKIDTLREEFYDYMSKISNEDKYEIEEYYNRTRNLKTYIPNGDHLTFDDVNLSALGIENIDPHQKAAVWKNVQNQGGLIDHEVGLGKTLTMILEAYLLKKLGKVEKPMIIGLPANYGDIYDAYTKLLPNAKVLFLDNTKNFSPENRQNTILQIANERWDAIVGSHSQFKMFKMPSEKQIEYIETSIQNCKDNLFNIKNEFGNTDITKKQISGLEKKIKNLDFKLKEKLESIAKQNEDNILSFDEMGIDHLIVDESHIFKNLDLETRHERVAGLTSQGSERSLNLFIGAEVIRERKGLDNFGLSMYSGTPIANQLAEGYTLKKYMIPQRLKDMGIYNFDSWASNFIIKATEYEVNTVGGVISKERFRYYINVPDLAGIYGSFTDIMTGDMAKIDRPVEDNRLIITPLLNTQKRFMRKLENFLATGNTEKLGLEKPLNISKDSTAKSIVAMNLAFKASLDMRLINSAYKDDPNSKINFLVRDMLQHYQDFNDIKSTQIAFIDLSTPKQSFTEKRIMQQVEDGVFTNIYDDIAGKLLRAGVKATEIAYVHDYDSPKKKAILNKKMNTGEIRILLGSTEKAGTGLNVQNQLLQIHNVTIPWRPSDLGQRIGRIKRRGNLFAKLYNNNKATIKTYATERTFDNLKINTVANKDKFIQQLKSATIDRNSVSREVDEGSLDENAGMNLAEFQAQISGDNTLLDFTKIKKEVEDVLKKKRDIENGKDLINIKIKHVTDEIESRIKAINIIDNTLQDNKITSEEVNSVPVYSDVKNPTEKNLKMYYEQFEKQKFVANQPIEIAEYKSFKLIHTFRDSQSYGKHHEYSIKSAKEKFSFMTADGHRNGSTINHFQNIINSLDRRNDKNKSILRQEQNKLEELKAIPIIEWSEQQENNYLQLKNTKEEFEHKLNARLQELKDIEPTFTEGHLLLDSIEKMIYALENDIISETNLSESFNVTQNVLEAMQKLEKQEIGFTVMPYGFTESGFTSVDVEVSDYMQLLNDMNYDEIFNIKNKENLQDENLNNNQMSR